MKLIYICFVLSAFLAGCQKNKPEQSQQQADASGQSTPAQSIPPNAIAGVTWEVPDGWAPHGARPMRIATYFVPPVEGDEEGGECAVFFFGTGQGGDVTDNIERWAGQFEGSPKAERSEKQINGLNVTLVRIAGSYLAPAGPMMQSQGTKEDYLLLGAIVNAPEGMVFFKMTGPKKTMTSSEEGFDELVESIRRAVVS